MGASITLAGESLIAQKQGAQQILTVSRFILANVPGLDPNGPVDRAAGKPAAGQIVGTYDITQAGYVNPNQVVYSLMLGSDIGDFDWNWIGLETAENVLLMVAYVPTQQKRRNIPPLQLGNNVTRNFLVVFDGAQALTGLTIDASTWQHDFTVRLAGIDERERQSNRDIYGRACFFGSALQLEKVGGAYQLKPGTAYVEGVRLQHSAALPVVPPAFPTTAWLDVALKRELNDVVASWSVVWGTAKVDYVDSAGVQHYCVALAELPNSNTVTDSRPVENIAGPLVAHFAARVGDYAGLRARATTKDDVGLDQIPNAIAKGAQKSSDRDDVISTTAFVKAVAGDASFLATATRNLSQGTDRQDPNIAIAPVIVTKHANTPDGANGFYWHITTTFYGTISATSDRAQIAVSYNSPTPMVWARSCLGNVWLPWVQLANTAFVKNAINAFGIGTNEGETAMPLLANLNRTDIPTGIYACNASTVGAPTAAAGIVQVSNKGTGNNLEFNWMTLANGEVWSRSTNANAIGPWARQLSDQNINTLYPLSSAGGAYSAPLPGGLILKLGTYSRAWAFAEGELVTLTFNDAFPSACLWGGAFPVNSSGGAHHETMYLRRSMSRSNAVIQAEGVTSQGLNGHEFAWIFVGY
ncbi:phage tail protein [Pseudomonas sp. zfem003]|uniref:phage tail-collar fiber domain-containing protein n=1 Tax=Pseudomonas sp. zfem003 TaxID=3078198 RepID=UPI002929F5C4|nr:phage tail protein [Pseudomonas sp. zfem003]MDU9400190.1 phage tail protein [Pseudomonas sp. zfem003]